ncbi:RapZ C-terminal domain-containing protein [Actinomadura sp. 3N407]|uniref:RapZ C-terminal domain-containing protein n=1 Tax=Actinomadura sp. 3N407 TaxID=3457423 RepID=UPI003FCD28E9
MHDHEITITTFGYLHGPAPAAHLTVDLREHFRDPHVDPALRNLTARDTAVHEAVRTTPGILALVDAAEHAVLAYLDGPSAGPVTIAVGCAGGRHRAATVGDLLATGLSETHGLAVTLTHRDLDKPVVDRPTAEPAAGSAAGRMRVVDQAAPMYVTLADRHTLASLPGPVEPGTMLGSHLTAVTDPRRLPVGELVFEHHYGNRIEARTLLDGTATARLLAVRDRGPDGWEVVGDAPLAGLLGPQADEILATARIAREYLRGDTGASPEAARYYAVADATGEAMGACLDAALAALAAAGVDAWWWSTAVSCAYGHELVAIAARDLIGTVPAWTAAAYDTLMAPWLAAGFGVDALGGVPSSLRSWSTPHPAYAPVDITPPELQPGEGLDASVAAGWAEPATDPAALPDLAERQAAALIGYGLDAEGRPLHPAGRTGRTGRNLGRWGENAAADPIVVAGAGLADRRVLLIRRADCGAWAIPGGMVDPGETAPAALVRELREETGVDLAALTPHVLARTLVADPRESDRAWVATTAALYRLPAPVAAVAGDDAADAGWFPFTDLAALEEALQRAGGTLYATHRPLLAAALERLASD